MSQIQEKFAEYFAISKELASLRKHQTTLKKKAESLEKDIKEHMTSNDLDSLSFKDGQIILYDRKNLQTFKKESMVECLKEELGDEHKAEKLAETIISNKIYKMEKKIKVNLKKN
jgi:hypothetical protein